MLYDIPRKPKAFESGMERVRACRTRTSFTGLRAPVSAVSASLPSEAANGDQGAPERRTNVGGWRGLVYDPEAAHFTWRAEAAPAR